MLVADPFNHYGRIYNLSKFGIIQKSTKSIFSSWPFSVFTVYMLKSEHKVLYHD